jgi:hypothetical protein
VVVVGFDEIVNPSRFWSLEDFLNNPSPVPREPGVYGWYFREIPPNVPIERCFHGIVCQLL